MFVTFFRSKDFYKLMPKLNNMKKLLFILLLIPGLLMAQSKKAVMLEYSFKTGDVIEMEQQTVQLISQNLMGMSQDTKNEISGIMRFEVKEVNGKDARMEAQYQSIKSNVSSAMGAVSMDSDGDEATTENRIMKSLVGRPFQFTLTSSGQVKDIENSENLITGLDDLGLDAATLTNLKQSLGQQYTGQGLKGTLEGGFVQYSNDKVKPKNEWQSEVLAGASFPLKTTNMWKLEKHNGKEASVNANGNIITTDKDKTFPLQMGMKGKTDLSGSQEIQSTVNVQNGWPTELKIKNTISGTLIILAGAMLPNDMDVPMEIKTESIFTFRSK